MSGALLLESKNEQTSKILDENIDFVSFDTKEELLDKIQYFLNNDLERELIIKNAKQKVKLEYNGIKFWEKIFNKLNLNISLK
jgi:spore maturation protein CgeB